MERSLGLVGWASVLAAISALHLALAATANATVATVTSVAIVTCTAAWTRRNPSTENPDE